MSLETIPLSWALRQCAGAIQEGVQQEDLFRQCLITPQFGDDRDRISPAQLTLLYMTICNSIEDEAHGLGQGKIDLGYSALAVRAVLGCPDLETAVKAAIRLYKLASSGVQMSLHYEGEDAVFSVNCPEGRRGSTALFLEDCYLSFMFMCFSHFINRPLPMIALETRDRFHMNLGRAHWSTRAFVNHADVSALRVPKAAMRLKRAGKPGDVSYRDLFRTWLDFVHTDSFAGLDSPYGIANLSVRDLAMQAGVSGSTIRRRLCSDNSSFREERQRILVESSVRMLMSGEDSVESIAARLGYSDARSFRRFLKSAAGKTPAEVRNDSASSFGAPIAHTQEVIRRIESLAETMSA